MIPYPQDHNFSIIKTLKTFTEIPHFNSYFPNQRKIKNTKQGARIGRPKRKKRLAQVDVIISALFFLIPKK